MYIANIVDGGGKKKKNNNGMNYTLVGIDNGLNPKPTTDDSATKASVKANINEKQWRTVPMPEDTITPPKDETPKGTAVADNGNKTETKVKSNVKVETPVAEVKQTEVPAQNNAQKSYSFLDTDLYANTMAQIDDIFNRMQNNNSAQKLDETLNALMNMESFTYDPSKDGMFANALASAMKSGQTAMANTMGQASMLTGGYGSSYATSAGAQAYNQVINNVYDNLPEFYQMSLNAYENEYNRALNNYNVASDAYNREMNELMNEYGMLTDTLNTGFKDYWSGVDADFNERNFNENARQFNESMALNRDKLNESIREFNTENEQNQAYREWQKGITEREIANSEANTAWNHKQAEIDNAYRQTMLDIENTENARNRSIQDAQLQSQGIIKNADGTYRYDSSLVPQTDKSNLKDNDAKLPSVKDTAVQKYLEGGESALTDYVASFDGYYTDDTLQSIFDYVATNSQSKDSDWGHTYTKTYNGIVGYETVKDENGKEYKIKDLNISDEAKEKLLKLKKGETYSFGN